ncbi:hypothetical protein BKA69DRAFT_1049545 [Paraphysoderma sedebokerense]|nr:hypothetical protein BKA69DRAFT_1049545 [Paraphysoderma sedebokerense]
MPLKTLQRTATFTWAPSLPNTADLPLYLATGSVAGALDASFSNSSDLELFEVNLGSDAVDDCKKVGKVQSQARFNRLAWSSFRTETAPYGTIAGGLENGDLVLYNPKAIVNSQAENATIFKKTSHSTAVRGLDFNPTQQNLLATGAGEGDILIWDMNDPSTPYSPGPTKTPKLLNSDVTYLSWNRQVPHILASSSSNGLTIVWDLKNKREVITLAPPAGMGQSMGGMWGGGPGMGGGAARRAGVVVAWNPELATQIITASEDDMNPVIMVWDLRNAHAPEKVLSGHSKGILSVSWCPKDSDLLLSCGKDNRTICWNPSTCEIMGELPPSQNWSFDVQWCPRNPDILSVASFDGKISVYSLQTSEGSKAAAANATTSDPFAPKTTTPSSIALKQPPKWLRRPVGVTWSFGGKLITFGHRSAPAQPAQPQQPGYTSPQQPTHSQPLPRHISIQSIATLPEVKKRSDEFETCLSGVGCVPKDFCARRKTELENSGKSHGVAAGPIIWEVMKMLFDEKEGRQILTTQLNGDKPYQYLKETPTDNVIPQVVEDVTTNDVTQTNGVIGDEGDSSEVFDKIRSLSIDSKSKPTGSSPFRVFPESFNDTDRQITTALLHGDFAAAVKYCVDSHRLADALMFAACGGPDLFNKTRDSYIKSHISKTPYLRIVEDIVQSNLKDLVENASLDEWDSIMISIMTYAKGPETNELARLLGRRLEAAYRKRTTTPGFFPLTLSSPKKGKNVPAVDPNSFFDNMNSTDTQTNESNEKESEAEQANVNGSVSPSSSSNSVATTMSIEQLCQNAVICYLVAGDIERMVYIWAQELGEIETASPIYKKSEPRWGPKYEIHAQFLQDFIELVGLVRKAISFVDKDLASDAGNVQATEEVSGTKTNFKSYKLAPMYRKYFEYADVLAHQGKLQLAWKYLGMIPNGFTPSMAKREGDVDTVLVLRDRVYEAIKGRLSKEGTGGLVAPEFPFKRVLVGKVEEPQPVVTSTQGQAYQQQSYGYSQTQYGYPQGGYTSSTPQYGQSTYQTSTYTSTPSYSAAPTSYGGYSGSSYAPYNPNPVSSAVTPAIQPPPTANQMIPTPQPNQFVPTPTPGMPPQPTSYDPIVSSTGPQPAAYSTGAAQPKTGWNDPPMIPTTQRRMSKPSTPAPITAPFPHQAGVPQSTSQYGPPQTSSPPSQNYQQNPTVTAPPPSTIGRTVPTNNSGYASASLAQPPVSSSGYAAAPLAQPPVSSSGYAAGHISQPSSTPPPSMRPTQNQYAPPPQSQQPQQQQPQQYQMQQPQGMGMGVRPPMGGAPYPSGGPGAGPAPGMGMGMQGPPPQDPNAKPAVQSTQNAAPSAPTKPRHPAGDRSHIPPQHLPIFKILDAALNKAKAMAPPQQKRMIDDVEKRLLSMFDALNNGDVSDVVSGQLISLVKAIESRDYGTASSIQVQLSTTQVNETAAWMIGVKRLIDIIKTLP